MNTTTKHLKEWVELNKAFPGSLGESQNKGEDKN